ncbi:molybdopterin synthase catalytic subunit MoaE [Pigmentiphaga sp.]|jgi:Molybdopterin converting factor, large subunit|uniref:molybdopterin synthase catalytic subunit MoaE n=1 Tax=Pigmentiphaga sp. TaxID=1977564 RepID=UPI0025EA24D9|nr:molybdopterin synthase catalytic subunit MoaE [Pigmentiphaga sp.]MBX6318269.1 molybdopterin synthase catalytic subunit MoaE [Pigmentiphaga sp.]
MSVSVQTSDFDAGAEIAAMRRDPSVGAIVTFVGTVRDVNEGDHVASLTLEHYPGMTEKALADIVEQAHGRWSLNAVRVIHRVGTLTAGDQIVFVGVAGRHRGECFAACEFIMDYLKTQAPFWKKEATDRGERWVEARDSDDQAAQRWQQG